MIGPYCTFSLVCLKVIPPWTQENKKPDFDKEAVSEEKETGDSVWKEPRDSAWRQTGCSGRDYLGSEVLSKK